ncbi:hypothetical protein K7X08_011845 [Anisodus acutangulus]|uniref:DUF3741 domain-containing protein n=1 Tax=Anisodus acutangulus TaxID=402998 RepID=A0A9Q1QY22_9SOLA|nr:hypothetical protein K7X08_011845 [Anisodus acutangulus]
MCSSSLPTHPAEAELDVVVCERAPGVVARLMGLESMSPFTTRPSISLRELESTKVRNHSFPEIPSTFLELEDENFFILSFESRGIVASKQRKNEIKQLRRRKEKLNNKTVNNENLPKKSDDKVIIMHNTATQRFPKLKESTNIFQPTHNSLQNLSSKSFKLIQDTEGEISITMKRRKKKKKKKEKFSRPTSSRSKRTLSEELENYRKLKLIGDNNRVEANKSSEGICDESWKRGYKDEYYVPLWRDICRLAGRETVERNWLHREICKFEYCKEIGGRIGLQILDHMLEELVDQLVGQPL